MPTANLPRTAAIRIRAPPVFVIPAKAGLQDPEIKAVALDPRFRGGDDL
jgi:hypothetical protein